MKLELYIPTGLHEIPLRAYQEFMKVSESNTDEVFIAEKMIQLFCGIELKDVVKIKASDLNDLIKHFETLFKSKPQFQNRFKIGQTEFGFIPDFENISWGEYIDLEANLSKWETMHKAMAVMYRPITKTKGDKYDIESYVSSNTYAEVMKYAPLNIALASSVFFWNLGKELLLHLMDYLEKEMKKESFQNIANEHNLAKSGDGIRVSMQLLKETLQDSMLSQPYPLRSASLI